jgi:DNA-binding Lrp family transcriptional regulator
VSETASYRLDPIDIHILKTLQSEGRITNVELAKRVGMTPPPCLRRVRALEKAGIITGYRALIDESAIGFDITAYVFVGLSQQAKSDLLAFEDYLKDDPHVRECTMVSGDVDFVLKCICRDIKSFNAFISDTLSNAPKVSNIKTAIVLQHHKDEGTYPDHGL